MGKAQENPPSKGVPERQRGWGMFVRLFDNLLLNRMNIPLWRFAFAARRCPPPKGDFLQFHPYLIILSKIMSDDIVE